MTDINIKILLGVVNDESKVENFICEVPVGCRVKLFSNRDLHLGVRAQNSGRGATGT